MPPVVGILVGVALLAALAISVAYASGWSPRPPAAGDAADMLGPERKAQAMIAMVLVVGAIVLFYGLNEPRRQANAFERQRETSIERGAHAFAQYCYGCHGYTGTGALVPGADILAANLTLRKATGDVDDDKKLYDFLTKTIARGRPNTPMPAWGLRDGGSLNDEEISELATFIMYPRWNEIEGLVAVGAPTPNVPGGGEGPDRQARGLILSKGCAACHTLQGLIGANGTIGPPLTTVGATAGSRKPGLSAEDYIRESIQTPSVFLVPGFQNLMPQIAMTPDELNALVTYLSSLGNPNAAPAAAPAAGGPAAGGAAPAAGGAAPGGTTPASPPGAGGGAQPNPAAAPGGQVSTPTTTQVPGTALPLGAPTSAPQ